MEHLMSQPDSFNAILLQESEPYWKNYLKHPFILIMDDGSLDHLLYKVWFEQYCSLECVEENNVLCALLDQLADVIDENRLGLLKETFHSCSQFEMDFWNQAWFD